VDSTWAAGGVDGAAAVSGSAGAVFSASLSACFRLRLSFLLGLEEPLESYGDDKYLACEPQGTDARWVEVAGKV